jgi:NTP pyrophosphatase (non-canonical NTP hydrolase)
MLSDYLFYLQKLQQKLEHQKKKQSQKQQQQQQKKPEDYIQALVALQNEVTDKLSILGLMPMSSLAEVTLLVFTTCILYCFQPLLKFVNMLN